MNETTISRKTRAALCLAMLVPALLNGGLIFARAAAKDVTVISVLFYACQLLSLLSTMIGLGSALFYLSKIRIKASVLLLLLTEGMALIPLLCAAVRTALDYPEDLGIVLTIEILAAVGNTLLMTLIHAVPLLLSYLFFFRKYLPTAEAPRLLPVRPLGRANLLTVCLLFLYQVVPLTVDLIELVRDWLYIYPNEMASIIFDYIYLLVSLLLGYFITYGTETLLHEE